MKYCPRCQNEFVAPGWQCPACNYLPNNVGGIPVLAPELAEGGGGFRPEVFEQLAALEAQNFWFRARNRLIIWALKNRFPEMHRYLEIGCGTGYVLSGVAQAYPAATVVGTEVFSVGLPYAASRVRTAELLQMDARQIPYVNEFDVIGAFDVLEHIDEDEMVLNSMLRALRPGGGIAITVPQHPWLWSTADEHACHVRRYKMGELREKVLRAGFRLQFETSFVSLLLPAMLASRLTRQRVNDQKDPLSELKLPALLNQVFGHIMDIERWLITNGLRFKLGGSRLLIATKEN
jgi:SAM-dependent methyltransferase